MKLKFAIIGCGRISKRHLQILTSGQWPNIELVSVVDIDKTKAEEASNDFNIPFFLNIDNMISSVGFDVGVVLTESGKHFEVAMQLIESGKHVIIEKPMCLRIEEGEKLVKTAKNHGVRIFTVKQNRYNKPVIKLKEALDQGRFGKLVIGTIRVRWSRNETYYGLANWRGTWAMDGGALTNQASHHIDLLEYMMGPVKSICAKSITALAPIEAEDTVVASVEFENGALGTIEATTATRPKDLEGSISVLGSGGSVEISGFAVNKIKHWEFCQGSQDDQLVSDSFSENPPSVYGYGHNAFYKSVIDSIVLDKPHPLEGDEGVKSLRLIHAIYESINTSAPVNIKSTNKYKNSKLGLR